MRDYSQIDSKNQTNQQIDMFNQIEDPSLDTSRSKENTRYYELEDGSSNNINILTGTQMKAQDK